MLRPDATASTLELTAPDDVAGLLEGLRSGDRNALDRVFALVYQELHGLARRQLAGQPQGATLSPTVLVHETYLKLIDASRRDYLDRRHLLAVAARAMRQIIIDGARRARAQKRGGALVRLSLDPSTAGDDHTPADAAADLIELEHALEALEALDERLARVVELRYFAGLSVEETGEVMAMSPRTVKREWRKARAFLFEALRESAPGPEPP
ncbi:MAG TPA: ECF-type sigma factor [Longimicrobiales bacterium]